MLVRIILLIILFFVSYTVINALFRVLGRTISAPDQPDPEAKVGKMVECCECGTYVPESEIVQRNIKGESREFCSNECLQEYKKEND